MGVVRAGGDGDGRSDSVLDALWRSQYGIRAQAQPPDGGTAQHATRPPGYSPLVICATSDRSTAQTAPPAGGSAFDLVSAAAPDDPPSDPYICVSAPATGSAVDAICAPGDLLPGRGGWSRLQDDRRQHKAAMYGAQLQVIDGGGLVRILQPHKAAQRDRYRVTGGVGTSPQHVGGVSGRVVMGMSQRSRRRMFELLHSLRSDGASPLWITLTWPAAFPDTAAARAAFTTWIKRVHRRWPMVAVVWRIAPQRRGAPHLHLLMWGVVDDGQRLQAVKSWIAASWHAIAGGGDAHHLQHGSHVRRVSHAAGIRRYIGKYQARGDGDIPGRSWGVVGRDLLPVGVVASHDVPAAVARDLVRYVRRACRVSMPLHDAGGVLTGRWLRRAPRLAADHGATRYGDPATWIAAAAHLAGAAARGSDLVMLQRADLALLGDRGGRSAVQLVARGALWRNYAGAVATRAGAAWSQAVKPLIYGVYTPIEQTGGGVITDASQNRQRWGRVLA